MRKCKIYHTGILEAVDGVIKEDRIYFDDGKNDHLISEGLFWAKEECEEGLIQFVVNNKWGFADIYTGDILIFPEYDYAGPFYQGQAHVIMGGDVDYEVNPPELKLSSLDSRHGYITPNGEISIPLHYDKAYDEPFGSSYILQKEEKYGLINKNNIPLIPFLYHHMSYDLGVDLLYCASLHPCDSCLDNPDPQWLKTHRIDSPLDCECSFTWSIFNSTGKELIGSILDEAPSYYIVEEGSHKGCQSQQYLLLKLGDLYGLMDNNGTVLLDKALSKEELDILAKPYLEAEMEEIDRIRKRSNAHINEPIERLLNEAHYERTGEISSFHLPSWMTFQLMENHDVILHVEKPEANLEEDAGAFDAWILALKSWIKEIKTIHLGWTPATDSLSPYYQQFLYRVKKAVGLFDWLKITAYEEELLEDLGNKDHEPSVLNSGQSEMSTDAEREKAKLIEEFLESYPEDLSEAAGLDPKEIYAELPMGLFDEKLSNEPALSPKGKTKIDLWGLNLEKKELHLFELKVKKNPSLGLYSQLFLCAMVQEDELSKKLSYDDEVEHEEESTLTQPSLTSLRAHFLAQSLHPLMDEGYINLVNQSFKLKNRAIRFDFIKYETQEIHSENMKEEL